MCPLHVDLRPSSLDEVYGNDSIKTSLESIFSRKKDFPHAYLFTGPSGCGKTTFGRIIASLLKCGEDDLFEYNTANMRGIDTVREIDQNCRYAPSSGKVKVYILDEIHRVTVDFMNALLKLLEDAPSHVFFILCINGNERIYNGSKFIKIADAKIGDHVFTEEGKALIKGKYFKGFSDTIELTTEKGSSIKVTPDHKMHVFNGEKIVWKAAKDLLQTDFLPIFHSYVKEGCSLLTKDECELLGRLVGDGYYTYKRLGVLYHENEWEQGKALLNRLKLSYKEYQKGKVYEVTIHHPKNIFFKERLGLKNYTKGKKILPEPVYSFSSDQVKWFLEGLLGADGSVSKRGYKILYSSNRILMQQLKIVLNAHGYFVNLRLGTRTFETDSKTTGVKAGTYNSHVMLFLLREPRIKISNILRKELIQKYKSCHSLATTVGYGKHLHLSRKMLEGVNDPDLEYLKKSCSFERFSKSVPLGKSKVYDLEIENTSHSFVVNNFSVHNCTTEPEKLLPTIHTRCTTYQVKPLLNNTMKQFLNDVVLGESIDDFSPKIIDKIIQASEGSPRQALVILDQVIDISNEEDALNAISSFIPEDIRELKEVYQILLEKSSPDKWDRIRGTIKALDLEPEKVRRATLGYFGAVLLNSKGNDKAAEILGCFTDSWFYLGKPGMIRSFYYSCQIK